MERKDCPFSFGEPTVFGPGDELCEWCELDLPELYRGNCPYLALRKELEACRANLRELQAEAEDHAKEIVELKGEVKKYREISEIQQGLKSDWMEEATSRQIEIVELKKKLEKITK